VLAGLAIAVGRQWTEVRRTLDRLEPGLVALALVLVLAGQLASMLAWRALVAGLGSPLRVPVAARIFFVGQLGKYLPGSVWPVLAQMDMGRAAGVPRTRIGAASILTIGVSVASGLFVGLLCLPALLAGGGHDYAWVLLGLPLAVALLHPRVLNAVLRRGLGLLRRPAPEQPVNARAVLAAGGWLLVTWLCYGLQIAVLATDLGASGVRVLPVAIGGFSIAMTLGLLFLVAPAGVGAREAVLILVLGSVLSAGAATALALVSRLLLTLSDGLVAGAAALAARRHSTRLLPPPAGTDPPLDRHPTR
jgi:uncharacterized membrane protein YbhN (UPF0104 family)